MTPNLRDALEWLVNLGHGVGKAGGEPEPGEIETALEYGKDELAASPAPAEGVRQETMSLHRCKVCGARWLLWPDAIHGGCWNLLDKYQRPGSCCDNVAMGEQIEHLRDFQVPVNLAAEGARSPLLDRINVMLNDPGFCHGRFVMVQELKPLLQDIAAALAGSPSPEGLHGPADGARTDALVKSVQSIGALRAHVGCGDVDIAGQWE